MPSVKPESNCEVTECGKDGKICEHKFTESALKKLPRSEVLKILENLAKNRNEDVPEEMLEYVKKGEKHKKWKKYALYSFIGIVVVLLVLSLLTPAAPLGAGALAGILGGAGAAEVLAPLLILVPGLFAGGLGINGRIISNKNKNKMIAYALALQEKDPEAYEMMKSLGEVTHNQIITGNTAEKIIQNTINTCGSLSPDRRSIITNGIDIGKINELLEYT